MKYTEILNRRLKKAGREYRTGNHSDKKERLWNAIQEIMEEAEGTGSFLPWTQAVQKLKLNEQQQMLIAVLWEQKPMGIVCPWKSSEDSGYRFTKKSRKI